MNQVQARRLLKLAEFLREVPKEKFDFGILAFQNGKPMLEALKAGKTACGTVACAIGWMPAVFPRSLVWKKVWAGGHGLQVRLKGRPYTDFNAAEVFFGITHDQSSWLFNPDPVDGGLAATVSAKQVARRITTFVRREQLNPSHGHQRARVPA